MHDRPADALEHAARLAGEYLAGVRLRRVFPTPAEVEGLCPLDADLPEGPSDPAAVLDALHTHASPATVACAGGRYFGFVIGGSLPAALGANVLASAWDQNAAMSVCSPAAVRIEAVTARWLLDLLRLDPACEVGFVTGATVANFTALCAARHRLLAAQGWSVEDDGLFGAPPIRVVVGEQVHASVRKALSLAGLGRSRVETVPADEQGRMIPGAIPPLDGRTLLCLQAGEVNTGAFDLFDEIIERARAAGAWVHVDGAFGLWARAAPSLDRLTRGIERADSWAADAHKWLNVPYDSGLIVCRDRAAIHAAMGIRAAYLDDRLASEPCWMTPELSRRARGVDVYAALRSLGRTGVSTLVERCCRHARTFAEGLRSAGHEVLNDVVLNQVLVRFGDDERTRTTIRLIQDEGVCWAGATEWRGVPAMRISVSSWVTTDDDVALSLGSMLRCAERARA
jgi:glutamate/tyrosine decarboxylase-like PLP-dependent enzyme